MAVGAPAGRRTEPGGLLIEDMVVVVVVAPAENKLVAAEWTAFEDKIGWGSRLPAVCNSDFAAEYTAFQDLSSQDTLGQNLFAEVAVVVVVQAAEPQLREETAQTLALPPGQPWRARLVELKEKDSAGSHSLPQPVSIPHRRLFPALLHHRHRHAECKLQSHRRRRRRPPRIHATSSCQD